MPLPKLGQVEGGIQSFGRAGEENRPMEVLCLPGVTRKDVKAQ